MTIDGEPPQSKAAERALLGTVMVAASECLADLADLDKQDFFFPEHVRLWECVRSLEARGAQVNTISVQDEARALGVVSALPDRESFCLTLAAEAAPVEHILGHANTIKRMATLRNLIVLSVEVRARAEQIADVDDVLADLRTGLEKLEASGGAGGAEQVCDLMDSVIAEVEARAGRRTAEHLANTGIEGVDRILGNFRRGHVVLIGGLPGMGKSSAARGILCHNVINHLPGVIFTNEMDRGEWIEALISLRSHIPATNLGRGRVEYSEWKNKILPIAKTICGYPLWIDDQMLTVNQTNGEARRWFSKHVRRAGRDYGLIVIDYLNLVLSDEKVENRNRELAKILVKFKRLAKDLRSTVIVVAQLNRKSATEKREPVMSDFRDCGEIESIADVILCPWRESYDKPQTTTPRPFEAERARWLILKQKGGATGGVDVLWHRERMEFCDAMPIPEPPRNYIDKDD